MNVEIQAHAAALVVALLRAGELDTADDFVQWAVEHLGYPELEELLEGDERA